MIGLLVWQQTIKSVLIRANNHFFRIFSLSLSATPSLFIYLICFFNCFAKTCPTIVYNRQHHCSHFIILIILIKTIIVIIIIIITVIVKALPQSLRMKEKHYDHRSNKRNSTDMVGNYALKIINIFLAFIVLQHLRFLPSPSFFI